MTNNNEKIPKLMRDTFIIYAISFILILALTIVFSYMNGDVILDNFMLNFRSYLLGSFSYNDEDIYFSSLRFENIGLFAVHFTLFFTYFFLWAFNNMHETYDRMGQTVQWIVCKFELLLALITLAAGLLITIFIRQNFFFCLPEAITLACFIHLLKITLLKNLDISGKIIINFSRILSILIAIVGIALFVLRYVE